MTTTIYDKTEKGREEISTRKHHLAPRLRTLLVLVDGKQTHDELLSKVGGIGLNEESLAELINGGFIEARVAVPPAPVAKTLPEASSAQAAVERQRPDEEYVLPEGQTQYQAIYQFYTETIKSTIGLRGYTLQLKVEKAGSIEEFRALRQPYLEAVLKAKGNEMARSLKHRLDQLLYYGEQVPQTTVAGLGTGSG